MISPKSICGSAPDYNFKLDEYEFRVILNFDIVSLKLSLILGLGK